MLYDTNKIKSVKLIPNKFIFANINRKYLISQNIYTKCFIRITTFYINGILDIEAMFRYKNRLFGYKKRYRFVWVE